MEEIRQLSVQLQRIQEMAPPKGVAVMTISSLLDGLKTPGSMVMVAAAASQAMAGTGNQLTVRPNKPEALPLLSLNSEMQKYNQMQQKMTTTTVTTNNNVVSAAATPLPPLTSIPSTKITMATPSTTTISPKDAEASQLHAAEKAINTELTGNCVAEEELKHQHIICERCYERCREGGHHPAHSAPLTECQLLGSPPPEGGLTFKNIKLECMCSQSDDLDQLPTTTTPTRRVTKRTAATNTPPPPGGVRGRKQSVRHYRHKDAKALSSTSLPSEDCSSTTTTTNQPISYISQRQQQLQHQLQPQQQICDNCKNKFKCQSVGKSYSSTSKQHRKLSRLSSKCSKLLTDIENSKRVPKSATMTAATAAAILPASSSLLQQQQRTLGANETSSIQKQYSTDDIVFYTTTDSSSEDDDDDDDDEEDNENGAEADVDEDNLAEDKCQPIFKIAGVDASSLSQSKSESKVPTNKGIEELPTTDLKAISQSLVNITTTPKRTPVTVPPNATTAVAAAAAAAAAVSAPGNSNNALLDTKTKPATSTTSVTTSTSATSAAPQTANGNGKTKRPDKLVLNLNDRSKFTKEVSV